jgi:ketohexokinase
MARILGTGIATLDIINTVDGYPPEDSEVRALRQDVRRGGNVANTLSVLAQCGHRCAFAGSLAQSPDGERITQDLSLRGIDLRHARRVAGATAPTSYILLNARNGSRSIVHYRDLPEYDFEPFSDIPLSEFDWLHFEARHCVELETMLAYARSLVTDQPLSLEIEKEREGLEFLYSYADILFFSRAFALGRGFEEPEAFLREARGWAPQALLVLAWGEAGAWALQGDTLLHAPAFPPERIVDTIGAGDTFIAGVIDAMVSGHPLERALEEGCRLAGRKIGQHGFDGLVEHKPVFRGQALCPVTALEDPGSRGFEVEINGRMRSIFVVRQGAAVHAYLNHCPHAGTELNWQPDAFLSMDRRHILCTVHGALFTIDSGQCVLGPCRNQSLTPLPVSIEQGHIVLNTEPSR